MNMKKIYLYVLVSAFTGMSLTSCDDFLDVESKTESNTGNFYKSVDDAELARSEERRVGQEC